MIEIAKKAALKAGEIIVTLKQRKLKKEIKGTADNFVTEGDIASEKKILEILKSKFPKYNYLSEETGKVDNGSEYWWVIDPIDGTSNYFSGMPFYGVSIGLLKNGEPFAGVIYLPEFEALYWSERGKGAFLNNKKIKVNTTAKLEEALVGFDLDWMGGRKKNFEELIIPIADEVRYAPILGCAAAGVAKVSEGIYGAYLHWAYPWDFTAGAAIVLEAGGKVTDYKGNNINWFDKDISLVASNGKLHNQLLSLIKV